MTRARVARRAAAGSSAAALPAAALAQVLRFEAPADVTLRAFFRRHPSLGRRDRGAIAETVFDVLRHHRLYAHLAQDATGVPEARLLALSGDRRQGRLVLPVLPFALRYSLPDWLADALRAGHGAARAEALAAALLHPAPLDLRVNTLKSTRAQVIASLAAAGIDAHPLPQWPDALRVAGKPALERSPAFESGWCEVQDLGSQLLAALVAPRRGQTVVDLCAGAGGKTLALAAAMRSSGQIYACDVSAARLLRMRRRLERSGATNVQPMAIADERDARLGRLHARADAVLVDAPCTGTGTLRRNPDLKWRTGPGELARLVATQRSILSAATALVRPGGALVFGTCSLLAQENDEQVAWFEAHHPHWRRRPAGEVLAGQGAHVDSQAIADGLLRLLPDRDGCDGFFAARWERPREQ
ncbi:MAG: RsmB/NOP family class I SAM-dependent RNA methyltransferase [Burkholderiaceae bacterium]|nr:RsmB/NOP family class I SAM-dependent RNA methyltransferase [Burkholderiaceae bacterium]MEB2350164.1 RsmB/NOP family class I SAM-dependent RNA methyltransferase [Burkholderiaceae bacterium]